MEAAATMPHVTFRAKHLESVGAGLTGCQQNPYVVDRITFLQVFEIA
jgi:hypothetical protein